MKHLKESIVVEALRKNQITVEGAVNVLTEASDYRFSKGENVYIAHGQHAGEFGKFVEEKNGGYATIDLGADGKPFDTPLIFLQRSNNK